MPPAATPATPATPPAGSPHQPPKRTPTAVIARASAARKSKPRRKGTILPVILPQLRQYRWWLIGGFTLGGIHGVAITFQNVAPKYLIDEVVLQHGTLHPHEFWTRVAELCVGYVIATIILRMTMWHIGYRLFTWVRERVILALRARFFRHVNHLCLRFHGEHPSGEIYSYLFGTPLNQVMGFYQHASMNGPGALLTLSTSLALAFWWDPTIACVLVVTLLISVMMMSHARQRIHDISADYQRIEGVISGQVADLLRGNRAVKLYGMEEHAAVTFESDARTIGMKSYERDIRTHMEWMKQEGLFYVSFATLMAVCAWRYTQAPDRVTPGIITAFCTSFVALQSPVNFLYTSFTLWGSCQAAAERIGEVLAQDSTTPDPVGGEVPVPLKGDLEFKNVTFAYEDKAVLREVSLKIPYGQRVAFVGPSGAGKSTVSQLLLRLYDPQDGAVSLDGVDLTHLRGTELRRRFGVVPQDPFIFRTTIRDNIRVARQRATDQEIRRACELANAWEFIEQLPQGLSTRVGEGGSSLSGGQRQRLAIARVLLADPPFFIFDEATSALDTLSERLIQQALEQNVVGRTSIFIAHRLATVKNVDRIVVLQDGAIAQDGTYDTLVAQDGLFRELVEGQRLRD